MAYDDLDNDILRVLIDDGRTSLRDIADQLDVSVTTVSYHLEDLEEGVIEGYKPVINYPEMGYTLTSILSIKAHGEGIQELVDELGDMDSFVDVYEVTGEIDILAFGKFKDTEEMNTTIKTLLDNPYVKETNTSMVLSTAKERDQIKP